MLLNVAKFPDSPKSLPLLGDTDPAIQRCWVSAVLHWFISVRLHPPRITELQD